LEKRGLRKTKALEQVPLEPVKELNLQDLWKFRWGFADAHLLYAT
jgi:hypothetical protein